MVPFLSGCRSYHVFIKINYNNSSCKLSWLMVSWLTMQLSGKHRQYESEIVVTNIQNRFGRWNVAQWKKHLSSMSKILGSVLSSTEKKGGGRESKLIWSLFLLHG